VRLKELHINNFKFFPKQDRKSPLLKIDGKNLLIYGENGSGKSTIYWALYTLLESSFKERDADVEKYFVRGGNHGLVNIHSPVNHQAHIKAVLTNGATTKDFLVSGDIPTIQAIRANSDVRESGMASDFINYRVLFRLHQAKHTNDNDLFPWFEDEILPYIRTGTQSFKETLKVLRNGPTKVNNLAGDQIFPYAALRNDADAGMKLNYKHYIKWERQVTKWNNSFKKFIKSTNLRANQILQQDFKQDFEIKLDFVPIKHNIIADSLNLNWLEPKINIVIPKFQKKRNAIKRAHSFLNEAKWTAIGLSIRLAILEDVTYRPSPVDLKCLVMDDMLLSLDMSNREIVLELLLSRYVTDYQLILMTHDSHFYELAKGKINALNRRGEWIYLEMYEDQKGKKKIPFIIEAKTDLQKAESFYKQKEFGACANHLRKATEHFVHEFVPKDHHYNPKYEKLNLSQMIGKSRAVARLRTFPAKIISDLDLMRTHIFNPQSHYDIYKPLFHVELERAIDTLKRASVLAGINL
jgi:energy-coupling factor transporter ATP-binding protein EcfA2